MDLSPQDKERLEELCAMSFDFARQNDVESLEILLKNGMNPNLANHKGDTLIMLASYYNALEAVRLLISYGADVDKVNDKNLTPLAGVCFKGYIAVASELLKAGANPDKVNAAGLSPYDFAILFRRKEIVKLIGKYSKKKIGLFKKMWLLW
ncbi:ankyrin repeat domain-containing protein [Helicobacter burdigaliensis]|uniref:ankyrin repeat domain-containing protein n=1 Tax=Helicobacter burdigaliensis TaxID=2315334 RepID=UPI000EF740D6|nr:ankyrin repeat domain-containing protein [Helicobacter burdigaliensis]